MPWTALLDGRRKGLVSGLAALIVHVGAVLALPSAQRTSVQPRSSELWLSTVTSPELTQEAPAIARDRSGFASAPAPLRSLRAQPTRASSVRARAQARAAAQALAPEPSPGQAGDPRVQAAPKPELLREDTGVPLSDDASEGALATGPGVRSNTGGPLPPTASGRGPGLLAVQNPCGGYFPASATVDHARVRVHVRVDQAGRASVTRVLTELPGGQDFGSAARACAAALRFAPAVDGVGLPVPGDAKLELSFHRS